MNKDVPSLDFMNICQALAKYFPVLTQEPNKQKDISF